ncbi:hypothetical protein KL921_004460 [Ogataea angusta]|nr:hypothetical protein KL921_004460 [Ogataea angusta]KAG7843697.1 hypothetical protein KL941_004679 [Ogataea angusta]KAG7855501.1 hypothetical protein KL919_004641 [Ogataea angusta]
MWDLAQQYPDSTPGPSPVHETRARERRSSLVDHRPLKRASSISFRVHTPSDYSSGASMTSCTSTTSLSSLGSLSSSARQLIMSRKTSPRHPTRLKTRFFSPFHSTNTSPVSPRLLETVEKLSIDNDAHPIFEIPEIVSLILHYVGHDDKERVPTEHAPVRKPPMSLNHARLIHGDHGEKVWQRTLSTSSTAPPTGNLHNCLLVNKLWHSLTLEVLQENLYFDADHKLMNYSPPRTAAPKSFVLHKLKSTQQHHLAGLHINPVNLEWLEFYICPRLLPSLHLYTAKLKKLVLPGSKAVDDVYLQQIAPLMPNLVHLDLRACEHITDAGLYAIGTHCPNLETLNCGRHTKGSLVTDASISHIVANCNLKTLGVAGCGVSDAVLWSLAYQKGHQLERLSLNSCWRLTDAGISSVLMMDRFPRLAVLEIRRLTGLQQLRPIVEFKKRQLRRKIAVLVEACEDLEARLRAEERSLDLEISTRIFEDISEWLNGDDLQDQIEERNLQRFVQRRSVLV